MLLGAKPDQPLDVPDIPLAIRSHAQPASEEICLPRGTTMQRAQRIIIEETLKSNDYNKEETAKTLGIGLRTLYRKLKEYGTG